MNRIIFNAIVFISLLVVTVFPAGIVRGVSQPEEAKISLIHAAENSIIIQLEVPYFRIIQEAISGQVYDRLIVPGATQTSEGGKPQLPIMSTLIGVPADGQVVMDFLDVKSTEIKGRYRIIPAPSPDQAEGDLQAGIWQLSEDKNAYRNNMIYPSSLASIAEEAWLRDQRMVRVEFYPFQWNTLDGSLIWNENIIVEIRFDQPESGHTSSPLEAVKTNNPFEMMLEQSLLNYDQAKDWRSQPKGEVRENRLIPNSILTPSSTSDLPGPRYKIEITEGGIYRLSYAELGNAGIEVESIDPSTFKLTSQGEEIAIYVHNVDDEHVFSQDEYIQFYGQKFSGERLAAVYADEDAQWATFDSQLPDDGSHTTWTPQFNAAMLEKYTDTNVYWLTVGGGPGLRMAGVDGSPGVAPVPVAYKETVKAEQSHFWKTTLFTSEDTWFWDQITVMPTNPVVTRTYTTTLSAVASGTYTATLRGEVVAATNNNSSIDDHHINIYLNDISHTQKLINKSWEGISRYHFEVEVPQSILADGENQLDLVVLLNTSEMTRDTIYLDWFEIDYYREFIAEEDQIIFSVDEPGLWKFELAGFSTQDVAVMDINNPIVPTMINGGEWQSDILTFGVNLPTAMKLIAGTATELDSSRIVYYNPPSFYTEADYVLITHKNFKDALQTLASYRESLGLKPLIVDVDDLYNQFNYGIFHPIAIKNFIRFTFEQWNLPPTYVVLVGDGHWNFKGYTSPNSYGGYDLSTIFIPPNLSWMDPWQGEVDSANLLGAVVGDDPLADVLIARLPVSNPDELNAIITKISNYENSPDQYWQRRSLFIADNFITLSGYDPAGNFPSYADQIINEYDLPGYYSDRIYQDTYDCGAGGDCSVVKQMIQDSVNITGTLLVNYIGHATVDRWSGEGIVTNNDIQFLSNNDQLPVILSMTCLDGYWIYPGREGLIEEMVRANGKGAIAGFSPTGLGVAAGHDYLHRGFYDSLFVNGNWTLGVAGQSAKINLFATGMNYDLLYTFTIFGDPALKIRNPYQFIIEADEISKEGYAKGTVTFPITLENTANITDTFELGLSGNAWTTTTTTTTPIGPLSPGSSVRVEIMVSIPETSPLGSVDQVKIEAISRGDRSQYRDLTLTTTSGLYTLYLPSIEN